VAQAESFLAANPDNAPAWLQLAQLSYDLEDWGRAVEAYRRYLELAPADPNVLSELGVSLRGVGRNEEALAAFDLAQELAPQHWQSRYNEALVLAFDMRRFDDAETVIEELRDLQPDNPDVERLAAAVERRRDAT
jgi:tetratricopeptide (TPR) repeat protein